MKSKCWFLLLAILQFWACKDSEPKYSFSDPQIIEILSDVHIAESFLHRSPVDLRDSLIFVYMDQIYQIHDITEEQYIHNLKILRKDPEKMNYLYEKILENLKKKEAQNN